jgi:hypothetical protein
MGAKSAESPWIILRFERRGSNAWAACTDSGGEAFSQLFFPDGVRPVAAHIRRRVETLHRWQHRVALFLDVDVDVNIEEEDLRNPRRSTRCGSRTRSPASPSRS